MSELRVVTMEDRRAVYALLDRMLDWLPPARLSVARDESSKPGVGTWRPCGVCGATGRLLGGKPCRQAHIRWPYGHGCVECRNCEQGHVRIPSRRGEPPAGTDQMLTAGRHELETEAHRKAENRRYVDAQLVKLAALARQRAGVEAADDELTRAVSAKERLYRTGSFGRLEVALLQLAIHAPLRHEAVRVFVIEGVTKPSPPVRARLDETVAWLAERMPRPILLPGDAIAEVEAWKRSLENGRTPEHRRLRAVRNAEIEHLRADHGWSLRRIGDTYALSAEGVRKILDRDPVASAPAA